jgi:hypothetical protein
MWAWRRRHGSDTVTLFTQRVDVPANGLGGHRKGLGQGFNGHKPLSLNHLSDFFMAFANRRHFSVFFGVHRSSGKLADFLHLDRASMPDESFRLRAY